MKKNFDHSVNNQRFEILNKCFDLTVKNKNELITKILLDNGAIPTTINSLYYLFIKVLPVPTMKPLSYTNLINYIREYILNMDTEFILFCIENKLIAHNLLEMLWPFIVETNYKQIINILIKKKYIHKILTLYTLQ